MNSQDRKLDEICKELGVEIELHEHYVDIYTKILEKINKRKKESLEMLDLIVGLQTENRMLKRKCDNLQDEYGEWKNNEEY